MNQIPLSNSPFLNRPVKVNNYGVNQENIEVIAHLADLDFGK